MAEENFAIDKTSLFNHQKRQSSSAVEKDFCVLCVSRELILIIEVKKKSIKLNEFPTKNEENMRKLISGAVIKKQSKLC